MYFQFTSYRENMNKVEFVIECQKYNKLPTYLN